MSTQILQLKITLTGSQPNIWRKILVPIDYSFFDLHVAIQDAIGWEDCHLHQFFTDSPFKRNSQYERLGLPMPEMEDLADERKIKLNQYLSKPKDTMFYEYDFGDSWMHEIKLEKILDSEPKAKYPQIIDGANACPPEDCGGIGGYYHLQETLNNPKDPEHQDMLDWLGLDDVSEFKPEEFNLKTVKFQDPTKVLKRLEKEIGI